MSVRTPGKQDSWSHEASPFHAGERAVQERVGKRDIVERFGRRVIRDWMPEQHRAFFAQLPFIAVGGLDNDGRPWASILSGRPGFIAAPDDRHLRIDALLVPGDPLADTLAPGQALGLLGLDFGTRRRNRVNTHLEKRHRGGLILAVDQSFGNCPQYIQTRSFRFARDPGPSAAEQSPERLERLDQKAQDLIGAADTFFVASYSETENETGADVSHRGGQPGFVKLEARGGADVLTIPDFSGNLHFNTLGNFLVNPRAGLTFIDFESGDLLMLSGEVVIVWDGPEVEAFRGAERAWRFTLSAGIRLKDAVPLRWDFGDYSPNSLITGTWQEAESVLAAEAKRDAWRGYRVTRIEDESEVIRSFYLAPDDDDALPRFEPGQYLTIRVVPEGYKKPVVRTYSLSSAPADRLYRISVKRETARRDSAGGDAGAPGVVSNFLHDRIAAGDRIEARAPRGSFTFDAAATRPAALIAAGVGITPMIAMLRHALQEGVRTRYVRPVTLIHGARTTRERAFFEEASRIAEASGGAVRSVSLIDRPADGEVRGRNFHGQGIIDTEALRRILPLDDYDFFLCGPPAFMQGVYDSLRKLGVRDSRITAETFGPAMLTRHADGDPNAGPDAAKPLRLEEPPSALVTFANSGVEQSWSPEDGTLLELAEACGLQPDHGCRNGACGLCATRINSGSVAYRHRPSAAVAEGEALICCAVPGGSGAKGDTETVHLELAM